MSTETSTVAAPTNNATANSAAVPAPAKLPAAPAKKPVRKAAKKATGNSPAAKKKSPTKPAAKKPVQKAVTQSAPKSAAKPASKSAPKPASKPAAKPKAKPVEQAAGDLKLKKPKLVRDSFTFPKDEYQAIAGLKQKALGLKHSAKKSEILRAGLMLLNALNDKAFLAALAKVPALKTGRPAKS
jgi:outer membrane biosynthesis protein TonB